MKADDAGLRMSLRRMHQRARCDDNAEDLSQRSDCMTLADALTELADYRAREEAGLLVRAAVPDDRGDSTMEAS